LLRIEAEEDAMHEPQALGAWLDRAKSNASAWKKALYIVLAGLVALNVFITPHDPHFPGESLPGFWAAFALVAAVVMVVVLKKIVYPLLARPEDDNGRP
jgi:antibiotic biosynthesis monooxygenase (ABM) superfamily enzyme